MTEQVHVVYTIQDGKRDRFLQSLQEVDQLDLLVCEGWRADDEVQRREALVKFTEAMELVLRKHDKKTTWRERPIEALIKLMLLEIEEFRVAFEFFEIKEARHELIDIANYCLICWDRMSMLDQESNVHAQDHKPR
jgi:hypothetical protein